MEFRLQNFMRLLLLWDSLLFGSCFFLHMSLEDTMFNVLWQHLIVDCAFEGSNVQCFIGCGFNWFKAIVCKVDFDGSDTEGLAHIRNEIFI